jgi:hypothetical protein
MHKVSVRTLTLLLLLLASVLAHQYVALMPTARADAIWLESGDPNDPNQGPLPECCFSAMHRTWLDDEPNEPSEPMPEMAGGWRGLLATGDDPNDPGEPIPERA